MTTVKLTVPYKPHQKQQLFHQSKARFRMLVCGRRWGKTLSGVNEFLKLIIKAGPDAVGFIVAPTYWHTTKCWREFFNYCSGDIIDDINRTDRYVRLFQNRHIWFKSAENPDSLRSEGLDILWMDEWAECKEEAWTLALRPALIDKHGKAIFTGTPKGHNWTFQLWTRGQDKNQPDYESWMWPSVTNPYLDPHEIEEFARDMPEMAYRQEILGEFIEDIGSVFRGVDECIDEKLECPSHDPNLRYVAGVDLAKHQDFTVICMLNQEGQLCDFDRFGEIDWVLQKRRIIAKAQQYNNARVLIDSTGIGDPIYDDLRRANVRVQGYKFTSASKADLIENLSIMIEQKQISYPEIPELINELKLYGYETLPSGTIRYGAPEGYHDDCVTALALAAWLARKPGEGYVITF